MRDFAAIDALNFPKGLDTRTPMLQLGSMTYQGTHETLLGSEVLLSEPSYSELVLESHAPPILI